MHGLVLSGGGGRGAYEFGVYKALHESGFRPQVISGSSVGAITAAAIASGRSVAEIEDMWRNLGTFSVLRPRMDLWRLPSWTHLVHLTPLRKFLTKNLDFDAIHDSSVKLRITAVDVNTGELVVFRNDEITIEHLLASSAMPLVFPMVHLNGRTYWDGGVASNTPIGPAIEAGATHIYTVLLSPVGARALRTPANLWEAITRLTELRLLGNLKEDIKQAQAVNKLITRGLDHPLWRHVDFHVISPRDGLGVTNILNFSRKRAREFVDWGHADGLEFIRTGCEHPVEDIARHESQEDVAHREPEGDVPVRVRHPHAHKKGKV